MLMAWPADTRRNETGDSMGQGNFGELQLHQDARQRSVGSRRPTDQQLLLSFMQSHGRHVDPSVSGHDIGDDVQCRWENLGHGQSGGNDAFQFVGSRSYHSASADDSNGSSRINNVEGGRQQNHQEILVRVQQLLQSTLSQGVLGSGERLGTLQQVCSDRGTPITSSASGARASPMQEAERMLSIGSGNWNSQNSCSRGGHGPSEARGDANEFVPSAPKDFPKDQYDFLGMQKDEDRHVFMKNEVLPRITSLEFRTIPGSNRQVHAASDGQNQGNVDSRVNVGALQHMLNRFQNLRQEQSRSAAFQEQRPVQRTESPVNRPRLSESQVIAKLQARLASLIQQQGQDYSSRSVTAQGSNQNYSAIGIGAGDHQAAVMQRLVRALSHRVEIDTSQNKQPIQVSGRAVVDNGRQISSPMAKRKGSGGHFLCSPPNLADRSNNAPVDDRTVQGLPPHIHRAPARNSTACRVPFACSRRQSYTKDCRDSAGSRSDVMVEQESMKGAKNAEYREIPCVQFVRQPTEEESAGAEIVIGSLQRVLPYLKASFSLPHFPGQSSAAERTESKDGWQSSEANDNRPRCSAESKDQDATVFLPSLLQEIGERAERSRCLSLGVMEWQRDSTFCFYELIQMLRRHLKLNSDPVAEILLSEQLTSMARTVKKEGEASSGNANKAEIPAIQENPSNGSHVRDGLCTASYGVRKGLSSLNPTGSSSSAGKGATLNDDINPTVTDDPSCLINESSACQKLGEPNLVQTSSADVSESTGKASFWTSVSPLTDEWLDNLCCPLADDTLVTLRDAFKEENKRAKLRKVSTNGKAACDVESKSSVVNSSGKALLAGLRDQKNALLVLEDETSPVLELHRLPMEFDCDLSSVCHKALQQVEAKQNQNSSVVISAWERIQDVSFPLWESMAECEVERMSNGKLNGECRRANENDDICFICESNRDSQNSNTNGGNGDCSSSQDDTSKGNNVHTHVYTNRSLAPFCLVDENLMNMKVSIDRLSSSLSSPNLEITSYLGNTDSKHKNSKHCMLAFDSKEWVKFDNKVIADREQELRSAEVLLALKSVNEEERNKMAKEFLFCTLGAEALERAGMRISPIPGVFFRKDSWVVEIVSTPSPRTPRGQQHHPNDDEAVKGEFPQSEISNSGRIQDSSSFQSPSVGSGRSDGSLKTVSRLTESSEVKDFQAISRRPSLSTVEFSKQFPTRIYGHLPACCLAVDAANLYRRSNGVACVESSQYTDASFSDLLCSRKRSRDELAFSKYWYSVFARFLEHDMTNKGQGLEGSENRFFKYAPRVMAVSVHAVRDVTSDCGRWLRRRLTLIHADDRSEALFCPPKSDGSDADTTSGVVDDEAMKRFSASCMLWKDHTKALGYMMKSRQLLLMNPPPWVECASPCGDACQSEEEKSTYGKSSDERGNAPSYSLRQRRRCPQSPGTTASRNLGVVGLSLSDESANYRLMRDGER